LVLVVLELEQQEATLFFQAQHQQVVARQVHLMAEATLAVAVVVEVVALEAHQLGAQVILHLLLHLKVMLAEQVETAVLNLVAVVVAVVVAQ
jgi:hypothetical protein